MYVIKKIKRPYVDIDIECTGKILLMVIGGRKPEPSWLKSLSFFDEIWAVDMGIETCREACVIPKMLIGDGDSSSPEAWEWAVEKNVPVRKFNKDKDLTDFQLALKIAKEERSDYSLFLTGCFGGRFDHMWSTAISMLHTEQAPPPIGMADGREGMIFLKGPALADFKFTDRPEAVSVIPFSERCSGVSLSGVRWPLCRASLDYSKPYSISNRLDEAMRMRAEIECGLAGIYWEWGISCRQQSCY